MNIFGTFFYRSSPRQRATRNSFTLLLLFAPLLGLPALGADPLPSWNEGQTKQNILTFVATVTNRHDRNFVSPTRRVAVFDNDGTLWCEQPIYPQFRFGMDRLKPVAERFPELKNREPFKSALAENLEGVTKSGVHGLIELTAATHGGLSMEQFDGVVKDWLATAKHPRFQQPYTNCVYQPMLELLAYLRASGFKIFIVSGGAVEFMRPWAEKIYAVPSDRIIGSTVKTKVELRHGSPVVVRLPEIEFINDKAEKIAAIQRVVGRRPIAAFGNSDGDLPMLQWTAGGNGSRLCVYIHHTDGEREYAYDRNASTGRLDKGLDEAKARGWTVAEMKRDWKRVFPFGEDTLSRK